MPQALIALGSNVGDRAHTLDRAIAALNAQSGTTVVAQSAWHESAPVGGPRQTPFLNGAAVVESSLSPHELLARLHEIERLLGRERHEHWGPRTLDLDLLLYDGVVIETSDLLVPHPRMAFRRFVLEPAAEVAGDWTHPTIGWTVDRLLAHLREAVDYVAISGVGATALVDAVAKITDIRPLPIRGLDEAGGHEGVRSPILRLETGIEFLATVEGLLDRRVWPEPERAAISDFWFDALCAAYRASLANNADRVTFDTACQQTRPKLMPAKLLVVLSDVGDADFNSFQGPVLHLNEVDLESQTHEVAAAVMAMRR